MIFPHSIGLYIESDRASIVLAELRFGTLRVLAQKMLYLNPDKKLDPQIKDIRHALEEMVQAYRVNGPVIHIGIPRNQCVLKFIDFPISVKENLRETLTYEMAKYVPFSESDIYFDCQILSEDKIKGRISVLLAVVKKEIVAPYLKIAEGLTVDLAGIDISPYAIAPFFSMGKKSVSRHFGVIYGDTDILEFMGFRKSRLQYSRCFRVTDTRDNFKESIAGEMAAMAQSMGDTDDQNRFKIFFCVKDVSEELIVQLQETVYASVVSVDFSETPISDLTMMPACGLSLKCLQKVSTGMNLLPAAFQKKIGKTGIRCFYMLVCLFVLASGVWGGGYFFKNRQILNQLQTSIENIQQTIGQVSVAAAEIQKIQNKINFLKLFPARDGRMIDILNELSERLPETAWINSFNFSKGKVRVEGVAANASELIPLIEASPYFSGAAFMSTIRKDNSGQENFTVGLDVDASSFP